MPENGFYLPRYFPYKVRILISKNTGQRKPEAYDQKYKLFLANSFVLAHSSAKKISTMNN